MVPNTTLLARTTMPSGYNGTFGPNSTYLVPTYMSQEEFFALQMTNGSDANTTLSNDTTVNLVLKTWYPSGYSPAHIIIASVVVTVLMIMVVVGNMLVIIAIVTEKALKNIQNWFIASLAVSDFFLGLVIMPFSLANELMGYWIFGFWWCEIHSAMDVLLCTASIMNLCLISLDRYWSITQAGKRAGGLPDENKRMINNGGVKQNKLKSIDEYNNEVPHPSRVNEAMVIEHASTCTIAKRMFVGEPCFGTNGSARPELYHSLTENRRETTTTLCFAVCLRDGNIYEDSRGGPEVKAPASHECGLASTEVTYSEVGRVT
ncbi:unnamed protein product [Spodoptera exigua]|nr:unnamed protein product [Spodoptera exigua]